MLGLVSVLIASVGWGNTVLANVWLLVSAASESAASESAASENSEAGDARKNLELSLEFFDYLGTLVERDGEWLDPLKLEEEFAKATSSRAAKTKVSEVEQ